MNDAGKMDKDKAEYLEALHKILTEQFKLKEGTEEYYMGAAGLKTNLDPESALDDVERAIELSPNNASYHLVKGKILLKLTKFLEAAREFLQATKLEERFALAWAYYGFAIALDLRRDDIDTLTLGTILLSYHTAVQYDSKCAQAYHFRAMTYGGLLNDLPRFIKNANMAIRLYKQSKDYDSFGSDVSMGLQELTQIKNGMKWKLNLIYFLSWLLSFFKGYYKDIPLSSI